MKRPGFAFALLTLAMTATSLAANLPGFWRNWQYSRAIQKIPEEHAGPATLQLPFEIFAHASYRGADFRVIDESGQEVPYFLRVPQPESKETVHPSEILECSFVPGKFTQVVVRIADGSWFNTYRIVTSEPDFIAWVETSVSDDAHEWRVIDARSPISRFRKNGLEGDQSIHFSGSSNQRYLRARIFVAEKQFPVESLQVLTRTSSDPQRLPLPVSFAPESSAEASESRWKGDFGTANLPASELSISTSQPDFYRAVRISTSSDQTEWQFAAAGETYRYKLGSEMKEHTRIDFPETFARYWRVEILNGNDHALEGARLEIRGLRREMTFLAGSGKSYKLLYGNQRAQAPEYDFARTFDRNTVAPVVELGAEETTTNFADPRPFMERHPNLLWLALGMAVAALGYAAVAALRPPKASPE